MRSERQKKGHGCLIAVIASVLSVVLIAVLIFATGFSEQITYRVKGWFYPQQYTAEVKAASEEFDVDRNLIYAVIHTESHFREEAESDAGAVGLMQLMPDTFTWLQQNLDGEVRYTEEDLKDPAVNIRYGTYYLSYLEDRYTSSYTAIAAYNAGFANVDGWLEDPAYSSDGVTLDDIPYPETKRYVEKVSGAWQEYEKLYGDGTPDSHWASHPDA